MKCSYLIIFIVFLISSCGLGFKSLGDDYYLDYNGVDDFCLVTPASGSGDLIVVYGHIVEYAFDDKFILLAETPRDSVDISQYLNKQYYILVKANDSLHGPMSKEDFLRVKNQQKVSKNLNLK